MTYLYTAVLGIYFTSMSVIAEPLVDPTMPADYKAKHSLTADVIIPDNQESPIWILNSTLIDPYRKVAIINGQQLVIGDIINEAEVVEISHQFVKLRYQDELVTINLHRSFISEIKSK